MPLDADVAYAMLPMPLLRADAAPPLYAAQRHEPFAAAKRCENAPKIKARGAPAQRAYYAAASAVQRSAPSVFRRLPPPPRAALSLRFERHRHHVTVCRATPDLPRWRLMPHASAPAALIYAAASICHAGSFLPIARATRLARRERAPRS